MAGGLTQTTMSGFGVSATSFIQRPHEGIRK